MATAEDWPSRRQGGDGKKVNCCHAQVNEKYWVYPPGGVYWEFAFGKLLISEEAFGCDLRPANPALGLPEPDTQGCCGTPAPTDRRLFVQKAEQPSRIFIKSQSNKTMQVSNNTVVAIRYKMKNNQGEVLENTMDSTPITYLHGVGSILPTLEADLAGLKAGDEKSVFISKDQGNEQMDDDFYMEVVIDYVRLATEEELRQGSTIQSTSQPDCGPGCCC